MSLIEITDCSVIKIQLSDISELEKAWLSVLLQNENENNCLINSQNINIYEKYHT